MGLNIGITVKKQPEGYGYHGFNPDGKVTEDVLIIALEDIKKGEWGKALLTTNAIKWWTAKKT
jgi:hypothetical protein